ncbi:hypothetical protein ACLK17_01245 [Escherichia coli]
MDRLAKTAPLVKKAAALGMQHWRSPFHQPLRSGEVLRSGAWRRINLIVGAVFNVHATCWVMVNPPDGTGGERYRYQNLTLLISKAYQRQ